LKGGAKAKAFQGGGGGPRAKFPKKANKWPGSGFFGGRERSTGRKGELGKRQSKGKQGLERGGGAEYNTNR